MRLRHTQHVTQKKGRFEFVRIGLPNSHLLSLDLKDLNLLHQIQ